MSWEAGEPRFVPLEYSLVELTQLDADAPTLTERAIGERHFALNESIDTSTTAIFANTIGSASVAQHNNMNNLTGSSGIGGIGGSVGGTTTGAISAARAALKFSQGTAFGRGADQQPVTASRSITSLRQKFSTEQGTAAQARAPISVLPSSSSFASLMPTAAHPTHSIFAPRRSNSASGAARIAAGGLNKHKVFFLLLFESSMIWLICRRLY